MMKALPTHTCRISSLIMKPLNIDGQLVILNFALRNGLTGKYSLSSSWLLGSRHPGLLNNSWPAMATSKRVQMLLSQLGYDEFVAFGLTLQEAKMDAGYRCYPPLP